MTDVFGPPFINAAGWTAALNHMPGGSATMLLNRAGGFWTRECFQALYIASWIHHPTEKGSYMIKLNPTQAGNVRQAYDQLLAAGALQSRVSSHLSKTGASAHQGWNFLNGYGELLVQIEGEAAGNPYLFLKSEGHPLTGVSGTAKHVHSWYVKTKTGKGITASPALNEWAKASTLIEERAAENYSPEYKAFLKQLGFKGTLTTVEDVVSTLYQRADSPPLPGFNANVLTQVQGDTHALANAMLAPTGVLFCLRSLRGVLAAKQITYTDNIERELRAIATRMLATATPQAEQVYNEIRITPAEIDQSLHTFNGYLA
ncbi:MAG: hypothetical protein JOZ48_03155 [Acidobacteriaceae bacterium]|nr:hypothetical protein [Acidobacteriaceae bacterium]